MLTSCHTHLQHADLQACIPFIHGVKIISICKKYLQPAAVNRDFVLGQLGQALAAVREVVEGGGEARDGDVCGVGDLIAALDSLDQMVVVDPGTFEVGQ